MTFKAQTIQRLMRVAPEIMGMLDPDEVFDKVLEEARAMTGARYAALGVLNEDRTELSRFVTSGMDPEAHRSIGDLPRGRGVLGVLIEDPRPLRVADVGSHHQSFGFPFGHPDMTTFLGVPVVIRGEVWGNLYLTEKTGGEEFTAEDEEFASALASMAATAIANARLYQDAERGRLESIQANRALEAARAVSDAIGAELDLASIFELIVKRGRALVSARAVYIWLASGDRMDLQAGTGIGSKDRREVSYNVVGTGAGRVLSTGVPLRLDYAPGTMNDTLKALGISDLHSVLIVPMIHRGHGIGVIMALDRGVERGPFTDADEELMLTFASAAANAVSVSRSVESDRLRATIDAAEEERRRWARELHDQTLQSLGGLRVLLSSARRKDQLEIFQDAVSQAVADLEFEIQNLRGIIADLRPPLLDDLGLRDALGALINRHRDRGLFAMLALDLVGPRGDEIALGTELETTVYRVIQEALSNVVKHAKAHSVAVDVTMTDRGMLVVEVRDDGVGFDSSERKSGFGMAGMRERAYLAGGTLAVESRRGGVGTTVHVELPISVSMSPVGDRRQKLREA